MIRILLPQGTYTPQRIKLLERITMLQVRKLDGVKRAYSYLELSRPDGFLEGFLENEKKLELACIMLSDNPLRIEQEGDAFSDLRTVLIEDADDIAGVPY